MYESPIKLIMGEMQTQVEENCMMVVQSYGFDVDKNELVKALEYDRGQYDKGFHDGTVRQLEELFGIESYERIIPESIQVKDTGYYNLQHKYMAIFLTEHIGGEQE